MGGCLTPEQSGWNVTRVLTSVCPDLSVAAESTTEEIWACVCTWCVWEWTCKGWCNHLGSASSMSTREGEKKKHSDRQGILVGVEMTTYNVPWNQLTISLSLISPWCPWGAETKSNLPPSVSFFLALTVSAAVSPGCWLAEGQVAFGQVQP